MKWQSRRKITAGRRKQQAYSKRRSRSRFTRLLGEHLEDRRLLTTTLFSDNFESGSLDTSRWPSSGPAQNRAYVTQEGTGYGAPISANTHAATISGSGNVDNTSMGMQSKTINLSGYHSARLNLLVQPEGNGNSPESHEDLFVKYRTSSATWANLPGTPIDQSSLSDSDFTDQGHTLPQNALHSNFAIRIYATGLDVDTECIGSHPNQYCFDFPADHWFVDNVSVVGSRPPSVSTSVPSTGTDATDHTLSWSVSDPDGDSISSVTAQLFRGNNEIPGRLSTAKNGSLKVFKSDGPGTYKITVTARDSTNAPRTKTSSSLVVSDDDTQSPTITVTGSSGTEITSQTQEFVWDISDASGTNSVITVTQDGAEIFKQFESDDPNRVALLQSLVTATSQQRSQKINDEAIVQAHAQAFSDQIQALNAQIAALQQIQPPPPDLQSQLGALFGQISQTGQQLSASLTALFAIQAEIAQLTSEIDEAQREIAGLTITPQNSYNFDAYGVGSFVLDIQATDLDRDRDNDQKSSSVTRVVNVLNSPPVAVFTVVTDPGDRKEGSPIEFSASASSDPENDALSFVWNFGDGTLATGENVSHVFDDDGLYDVKLVVVDSFDLKDEIINPIVISNQAPNLIATSPPSVAEASPFVLDIAATDPGDDTTTYDVDWGDGTSDTYTSGGEKSHVYANGGVQHTVSVSLLDEDGSYPDQYVATVDVENAAPIVSGFPSFISAEVGQPIDWNVGITDGDNDTHTLVWDFGDLSSESGVGLTSVQHAYASEGSYSASLTVTDSDGLSTIATANVAIGSPVSFVSDSQTVSEDAGTLTISAELSNGNPLNHDVTIALAVGGDVSETDYDLFLPQIVILEGQTFGSVEINITDDTRDENTEDLLVIMDSITGASVGAIGESRIEIEDNDDPPAVYFSSAGQSVGEDVGIATLTASLTSISGRDVIVPLTFTGSATFANDYSAVASILIPAGALSGTTDITIIDDNAIESAESIVATMHATPETILTTEEGQPTTVALILAASDAPDVTFDSAYRLTTEAGSSFFISARLSQFSDELISVPFAISGTAENGLDYRLVNSTLVFAPGSSSASIELDVIDDTISETVETAIVELQAVANASLGTTQLTVTDILDDDLVRVSFESAESSEFEGNTLPVRIVLSNPSATEVIVPIAVQGTSLSGLDYTVDISELRFAPGEQQAYVNVSILDDLINEITERIYLSIGHNLTGGFAGDIITHQVDIKDTDPLVSLRGPTSSIFVESDGSVSLTAKLSAPTDEPITVPVKYSGTAKRGSDFTAPLSVVIPAGTTSKSFSLSIVDDSANEATEKVTAAFGNLTAGILQTPTRASFSIEDNDSPITVYWKSRFRNVDESAETQLLTIGLTRPASQDVVVDVSFESKGRVIRSKSGNSVLGRIRNVVGDLRSVSQIFGEAEEEKDIHVESTRVVIPAGQVVAAVEVDLIDDHLKEDPEEVVFKFDTVTNANLPVDPANRLSRLVISDRDTFTAGMENNFRADLQGASTEDLAGGDVSGDLGAATGDLDSQAGAESFIYKAIELAAGGTLSEYTGIPGVGNIYAEAAIHAVVWTQSQYPAGFGIDLDQLQHDADFFTARTIDNGRARGDGIYFENLAKEMIDWAMLQVANYLYAGILDSLSVDADALIRKLTPEAATAINEFYQEHEERISNGYEQARKNTEGFFDDPGGTTADEFNRIEDNFIGALGGHVEGSTIIFDRDFNLVHSEDEPFGITESNGKAFITNLNLGDQDGDRVLEPDEGQWVVFGGVDTSIDKSITIAFVGPSDYRYITPTSTLISSMVNSGAFDRNFEGVRLAEQRFFQATGLPTIDLAKLDILEEAAAGNVLAATLFAKETQYYNAVVSIAGLVEAADTGLPFSQLSNVVFADLADKISVSGSSLDLTNPLVVKSLLQGVSVRTGISIDPNIATAVADTLARSNAIIEVQNPEGSTEFLDKIVQAHQFVQSDLTNEFVDLVKGNLSIVEFNSNNSDLESRIGAAETFDILPVYLFVEDASIAEGNTGDNTIVEITVTPIGTSVHPVSVTFASQDRNAIAGDDYGSVNGTLDWAAGDESSRTISVVIASDEELEPNEAFALVFSNPQNATLVTAEVNGIIENDDAFTFISPDVIDNDLILSIQNSFVLLENNGEVIYKTIAGQGSVIELTGQSNDTLNIADLLSEEIVTRTTLDGSKTISLSGHTIRTAGITLANPDIATTIAGLPQHIFTDVPLDLTAIAPTSLDESSLNYSWSLYSEGSTEPILTGTSVDFAFTPELTNSLLEITVNDDVRTSTTQLELLVVTPADLSISMSDSPDPVLAGNQLTYTVTVDNNGPTDAQNVVVTDVLPAGTIYVSDTDNCVESSTGTLTCSLGSIAANDSDSFDIAVFVDASVPHGTTITNNASVADVGIETADPNTDNNSISEDTLVNAEANLSVSKSDSLDPPTGTLTYTVTVNNAGPSDAQNVVVTDLLPADVTYVSDTDNCVELPVGTLTCSLGGIPATDTASFDIIVTVNAGAPVTVTNAATVASETTDPNADDNETSLVSIVKVKDPSSPFVDKNNDDLFLLADGDVLIGAAELGDGKFNTSKSEGGYTAIPGAGLVLPASADLVDGVDNDVISLPDIHFVADGNLIVDLDLTATAKHVKLTSRNGDVRLDDPTVTADNGKVKFDAAVDIIMTDGDEVAAKQVDFRAGNSIDFSNSKVSGGDSVRMNAGGNIIGVNAIVKALTPGKGKVDLNAEGMADLAGANVFGDKVVDLDVIGNIDAVGATLASCGNKGVVKVKSRMGNLNMEDGTAVASRQVKLEALGKTAGTGNVNVQNALVAILQGGSPKGKLNIKAIDELFKEGLQLLGPGKKDLSFGSSTGDHNEIGSLPDCPACP